MYIPTKEALCNALSDLLQNIYLDDITVRMVCTKAGVSRQALYNHYYGLTDVLEDLLTRRLNSAIGDANTYLTWDSGFERILVCLQENRALLLHVYHSTCRSELLGMLRRYGASLISRGIAQCSSDLGLPVSEEDQ
ncbi:MAG: TetR/AcrR family transcriptional regulator, partial [Eubacterium sp.]|nr:TetR/AcrR family transcriptional regulator [Eubacterium sp.]